MIIQCHIDELFIKNNRKFPQASLWFFNDIKFRFDLDIFEKIDY